ncbi:dynamin family protein [Bacillus sp. V3B]|uniref:dynamin family protein n=1 Tax=Bacillus sp. V3B TaxID=2804915 RepID=UPI00210DF6F8|nr:dynamin family protein [Bacillus sp. V3B]MCQ6274781.1 dynamin family protein [Bacillus sp. V3B]
MEELRVSLDKIKLSSDEQGIVEKLIAQSELEQVVIGLFGSFSVGKSELLNKMIGREGLLPTHTNETTAIVTSITYGDEDKIELIYSDGRVTTTSRENLHALVAGENVAEIEKIAIALLEPEWLKQVEFIDTPGRNTKFTAHVEASKQAIIDADVAVYVLPWQGLTAEDIVYLKDLMIYQPNLYFILNKVDRIEEGQGQTIEEVRLNVEKELTDQLGKGFPVYAISAKTGFNLSVFQDEFIPQVTANIKQFKQQRFTHAIEELITRHARSIEHEINLLELANSQDRQAFQDQKRKVEVEQTKLNGHVSKELAILNEMLAGVQTDTSSFIEATLRQTMQQIKPKLLAKYAQRHESEALNTIVESNLLTARNKIYQRFEAKIDEAIMDKKHYKLSELESSGANIEFQEPSFEDLQERYQERLQELAEQYDSKKNRLEQVLNDPNENVLDTEIEELQQAMVQLEEQMREEYVPEYIVDENFDPNKSTKILKFIGVAGDIGVSIALAVATAGISAGAQVAGKAGAEVAKQTGKEATKQLTKQVGKEAGKQATKQLTKQVVKETGEAIGKEVIEQTVKKVGKETLKQAGKETLKQGGKETLKKVGLESLKVIGNLASPVETAATAIGQAIDSTRKIDTVLNVEHRQKFFMKKQQIKSQFQLKKNELNQLKEQQKSNVTIVRNIEIKMEQIERNKEEEFKKLEQAMKHDQEQLNKVKFEESIHEQLDVLSSSEQDKYKMWVKLELDKVSLMLENTIPSYYHNEFSKLMQQIESVEADSKLNQGTITERLAELQQELSICHKMKQRITYG